MTSSSAEQKAIGLEISILPFKSDEIDVPIALLRLNSTRMIMIVGTMVYKIFSETENK